MLLDVVLLRLLCDEVMSMQTEVKLVPQTRVRLRATVIMSFERSSARVPREQAQKVRRPIHGGFEGQTTPLPRPRERYLM
jgi:hypothetical protein